MTNPDSTVEEHWRELSATMTRMSDSADTVRRWGRHLVTVLGGGGRLLACGNGGSAAEAQHLTAELVGRFKDDRAPFSAIPLHADTSTVTAIVNDYGDQEVFARQVQAHGRSGDVLVVLSTSGRSQNAVAAAKIGQECGLTVWSLTGPTPNPLASASHEYIAVETTSVPTVQEAHLAIIHALCAVFDETLKQGS